MIEDKPEGLIQLDPGSMEIFQRKQKIKKSQPIVKDPAPINIIYVPKDISNEETKKFTLNHPIDNK